MNEKVKIYCIYNAEGSIIGELKYLYDKYIRDIKCSMCDITHNTLSEKKEWKKRCMVSPFKIECLHLDELPKDIENLVEGNTPCVVAKTSSTNEIIIENKELIAMKGNVDSFFNHIHKIIKSQNRIVNI